MDLQASKPASKQRSKEAAQRPCNQTSKQGSLQANKLEILYVILCILYSGFWVHLFFLRYSLMLSSRIRTRIIHAVKLPPHAGLAALRPMQRLRLNHQPRCCFASSAATRVSSIFWANSVENICTTPSGGPLSMMSLILSERPMERNCSNDGTRLRVT